MLRSSSLWEAAWKMRQLSEGDSPQSPGTGGGDNGGEMENPWDGRVPLWCLWFMWCWTEELKTELFRQINVFTREDVNGKGSVEAMLNLKVTSPTIYHLYPSRPVLQVLCILFVQFQCAIGNSHRLLLKLQLLASTLHSKKAASILRRDFFFSQLNLFCS